MHLDLPAAQTGQAIQVHPLDSQRRPVRDRRRQDIDRIQLRDFRGGLAQGPMPLGSLRFRFRKGRAEEEQALFGVLVSSLFDSTPRTVRRPRAADFNLQVASTTLTRGHLIRSPDDAKIKDKMLLASSHEALKHRLDGIAFEVQATDPAEISYDTGASSAPRGSLLCPI